MYVYVRCFGWKASANFSCCPQGALNINERTIPQPRVLQLSVEKLSRDAAFLMDNGTVSVFYSNERNKMKDLDENL